MAISTRASRLRRCLTSALRLLAGAVSVVTASFAGSWGADTLRPPPPNAPKDAPAEFTRFELHELERGFLRLAFGSDLQTVGENDDRIHKFDHRIRIRISSSGRIDRSSLYRQVVDDFVLRVPGLDAIFVDEFSPPDVIVRLVDTRDFSKSLAAALGKNIATEFIKRTNPRCTTRSRASQQGSILRADVFIVVDQGTGVFLDCAYHETMHAFGLMNHGDDIPWTTLNQKRKVGYLSVYDQFMLRILYDPLVRAGMHKSEVEELLPKLFGRRD